MTKQSIPKLTKKNRRPAANSLAAALRWDTIAAQGAAGAEGDQAEGTQATAQAAARPAQGAAGDQAAAGAASAGAQTSPKKEQ
jgi:hypothetical protein